MQRTINARLCTENGILKGYFGREQLTPCPEHTADSLGIQYKSLDKNKLISMTEAGEMYSLLGGKLSFCHCKKDCNTSKICKCKKMKKMCGQFCHGGSGKNPHCRNRPPPIVAGESETALCQPCSAAAL